MHAVMQHGARNIRSETHHQSIASSCAVEVIQEILFEVKKLYEHEELKSHKGSL